VLPAETPGSARVLAVAVPPPTAPGAATVASCPAGLPRPRPLTNAPMAVVTGEAIVSPPPFAPQTVKPPCWPSRWAFGTPPGSASPSASTPSRWPSKAVSCCRSGIRRASFVNVQTVVLMDAEGPRAEKVSVQKAAE